MIFIDGIDMKRSSVEIEVNGNLSHSSQRERVDGQILQPMGVGKCFYIPCALNGDPMVRPRSSVRVGFPY